MTIGLMQHTFRSPGFLFSNRKWEFY